MSKVKVKYVGQVSPAEVLLPDADTGLWEPQHNRRLHVETGDVIEVDSAIAGEPAAWRSVGQDEVRLGYRQYRESDDGKKTEVYDLGTGLLAADSLWVPATAKAKTTKEPGDVVDLGDVDGHTEPPVSSEKGA